MSKRKQSDASIIEEMHARKKEGDELWTTLHSAYREGNRFVNAKDGQFTQDERDRMGEPIVQENRVLSFTNYIINGAVKQEIGCDVEPVSEGADAKLGRVRQAQIMKLWELGKGKQAAATGLRHAVNGGFGVLSYEITYASDKGLDKTIIPVALKDPTTFICDPSARAPGMADMDWAIVEDRISRGSFKKQFGEWKDLQGKDRDKWERGDKKIVYQYWRIVKQSEKTYYDVNGKGYTEKELSEWDESTERPDLGDEPVTRETPKNRVEQIIITNDRVVKTVVFAGCRLPFKVVEGREYWSEGKKELQSMALHAMAPQRKLNFLESQKMLLYSKGPTEMVFVPVEGDNAGLEHKITEAARNGSKNVVIIPYKSLDAQGNRLNQPNFKPQLLGDPFLTAEAEKAVEAIEAVIGITRGALMARPQDASGVAIHASEEQGETTNYDFIDNWLIALEELFRDWIYVIPKLGISMQIKLAGDDQRDEVVWINNQAAAIRDGKKNYDLDEDEEYALTLKVGPNPKTMRDKAFNQMNDYTKRHPELSPLIGDLDARASLDNKYADDIASRAHANIAHNAPWVFDQNQQDPKTAMMQQQLQQAHGMIQQMQQGMQQMQQEAQQKLNALTSQLQGLKADKSNEARRIELENQIKQQEIELKASADNTAKFEAMTNRMKAEQAAALKVLSPAALLTQQEGQSTEGGSVATSP